MAATGVRAASFDRELARVKQAERCRRLLAGVRSEAEEEALDRLTRGCAYSAAGFAQAAAVLRMLRGVGVFDRDGRRR